MLAGLAALPLEAAAPATSKVQLRFISLNQTIVGAGVAGGDGEATPLVITSDSLSRPVSHASGRVRLVSVKPQPQTETKRVAPHNPDDLNAPVPGFRRKPTSEDQAKVKAGDRELAAIDLPPGDHQRFIIIVHPGKGPGLTAIPDRIGFFPPGSDRYVNLTGTMVIVEVPAGRQQIPPNGTLVMRPGATHAQPYQLRLLAKKQGEEKLFFSAYTALDEERRNLRILVPRGEDGEEIVMKTISDGLAANDNYR